ncbi:MULTISPECIES: lanthionine synthetase LanC family protein [unclassified Sphingobacterium]|uniref:lanthionine synthetase LanC family protein n=1 Tax=unclassified Sphingobacterium TaxID=2609468 RepID=UPI0025D83DCD|nr:MULTISPECIES: lanthionine synthetase LanC family protein [unclassified Sphingobacterium]
MDKLEEEVFAIERILSKQNDSFASPYLFGDLGGKTLFYFYLWKYYGLDKYHDIAFKTLEKILSKVSISKLDYSICSGISGIAWLIDICNREGFIEESADDILPSLEDELSKCIKLSFAEKNMDYLHGGTGALIYLLNKASQGPYNVENLTLLLDNLLANCTLISDTMACTTYFSRSKNNAHYNTINLGVSHGMISVMHALNLFLKLKIRSDEVRSMLDKMINLIMFVTNNTVNEYYFPYDIDLRDLTKKSGSRIAWCYGDLGNSAVLYDLSYKVGRLDLELKLQEIIKSVCKLSIEKQSIKDGSLCHGLIGNALLCNYLNRHLENDDLYSLVSTNLHLYISKFPDPINYRKHFIVNVGYRDNNTLLEGLSGIGLGLLTILKNDKPLWTEILLLN